MLKMLLDPMGGIVITNDGNAILREVDVSHPAAKSMIELSRAQEEEVGDGTTSVIILSKLRLSSPHLRCSYPSFRWRNPCSGRTTIREKLSPNSHCVRLHESITNRS